MPTTTWSCPDCKSKYKVQYMDIGSKDHEHHACEVCGHVFVDAKVPVIYTPTLTKRGKKPETGDVDFEGSDSE